MRIQSNAPALNAIRNLGIHNNRIAKAMGRLSSGSRINSAADDPAGFAVAEKLKAQLTRLDTDKKNAIDYQSALQAAEGSLNEVQSMMSRMYELANMASNGTYTDMDREQFDKEYQQLLDEINRIGSSSTFNGKNLFGENKIKNSAGGTGGAGGGLTGDIIGKGNNLEAYLDAVDKLTQQIADAAKNGDDEKLLSLGIDRSNGKSDSENLKNAILNFSKVNGQQLLNTPLNGNEKGGTQYKLILSDGEIAVDLFSVSSEAYGLEDSNVLTQQDAKKAAEALKNAISKVSSQRGSIGATYNRLEHTINNLSSMSANLTDALSRITDADMAQEMMNLVKEQMLAQASTFALAQANQQPDQVLTLINSM